MDAQRWQWIQSLFHDAAAQPEAARHSFLATACAGDAEAMDEVLSLLEEDVRKTSLLDRDIGQVARGVIGDAPSRLASISTLPL
jgi:hypothetical protein